VKSMDNPAASAMPDQRYQANNSIVKGDCQRHQEG
jgi:hypothetical protein